jgi:Lrp/AsnC family transcriptional regulator for asnA, asnC and gidA
MSNYQQLDEHDQKIVDMLRIDGRVPYREVARRLGISEGTVRKRVGKLLEAGWLRILAVSDPLKLGVPILATTYAQVSPQYLEYVTDQLAACGAVRYVAVCVGSNNLVVESLHASNAELHDFIQQRLGVEGIVSSETMQVVKIKKSIWDWQLPATVTRRDNKRKRPLEPKESP